MVKLGGDAVGFGVFGVGDYINIWKFMHKLNKLRNADSMIFAGYERRDDVLGGKRRIVGNTSFLTPLIYIVNGIHLTILGEQKIDFENAMTELIVEEKSFV